MSGLHDSRATTHCFVMSSNSRLLIIAHSLDRSLMLWCSAGHGSASSTVSVELALPDAALLVPRYIAIATRLGVHVHELSERAETWLSIGRRRIPLLSGRIISRQHSIVKQCSYIRALDLVRSLMAMAWQTRCLLNCSTRVEFYR